ncbi:MAG: exo-alpha-sialidase [Planctomycetaceae bacterium]
MKTSRGEIPQLVFDDALNNFPPKKLATGEWMMTKRSAQRDVSILIGGVTAINDWQEFPLSTYQAADGGQPEEPFWWKLPGDHLVGLFRDNSRSGRLMRAFSTDHGRSWSKLVKTNFPDATSKFHLTHLSNGYYVLISNANPKQRNPLCLSVSKDGLVFDRMVRLPVPVGLENPHWAKSSRFGSTSYESWQYPHSIEQDGKLLVAFSRRKQSVEVIQVDINEIAGLYTDK